jgi:hypothetical protein
MPIDQNQESAKKPSALRSRGLNIRGVANEEVTKWVDTIRTELKETETGEDLKDLGYTVKVSQIDKNIHNLPMAGFLMVFTFENTTIVQPWFIEKTLTADRSIERKRNGEQPFMYYRTPSDFLLEKKTAAKIRNIVKTEIGESAKMLIPAFIPTHMNVEDVVGFRDWFFACFNNVNAEIDYLTKRDSEINIGSIFSKVGSDYSDPDSEREYRLRIVLDKDEPTFDLSGHPVRNDLTVYLSDVSDDNSANMFEINAHVDHLLDEKQCAILASRASSQNYAQPGMFGNNSNGSDLCPVFRPLVMVKNQTPGEALEINSLEIKLSALLVASSLIVEESKYFAQVYMPRNNINPEKDFRDIGAFNYETGLLLDENNNTYLPDIRHMYNSNNGADLWGYIERTVILKGPVLGMSVELAGLEYAIERHFSMVCLGGAKAAESYNRIKRAADNLTEGKFSPIFEKACAEQGVAPEERVATNIGTFYKGTYSDSEGVTYDLDNICRLTVTKIKGATEKSEMVDVFGDTLDRPNISEPEYDMTVRHRIQSAIAPSAIHITGSYHKIAFYPLFIKSLAHAAQLAGLDIKNVTENPGNARIIRGNNTASGLAMNDFNGSFMSTSTSPRGNSSLSW